MRGILGVIEAPSLDSLILCGVHEFDGYGWDWDGVLNFPALRSLSLWDISVDVDSVRTILASCPTITTLTLDFTCIDVLRVLARPSLPLIKELKHLRIVRTACHFDPGDFAHLPSLVSAIVTSSSLQIEKVDVDLDLWTALSESGILESVQSRILVVPCASQASCMLSQPS